MANLHSSVEKTINFVFADVEKRESVSEQRKRIATLKSHLGKVVTLSLDEICTDENIRKSIDTESEGFLRLVESVKKYGLLENIVAELRVADDGSDYKLVCIAGHRRILAAKAANNITKVPCLLQSYVKKGDRVGAALAENLNREDLHCLDVADGYQALLVAGWAEEELASHFCRDIRTIRHYVKMAGWGDDIKTMLRHHPNVFSTRVIMRQFAYKKFASLADFKRKIKELASPSEKAKVTKKSKASAPLADRRVMKRSLDTYLGEQVYLSVVIKEEIAKAFAAMGLI